jgi:predicted TIM-barrel fold metal-dependent hydrolase
MGRRGEWIGGKPEGRPSDIFRRHFSISPFFEEDHQQLLDLLGPEAIIFGSDWPHPEGLAAPIEYLESLPHSTPQNHVRMIMRDNARRLVGLPALVA